MMNIENQRLRHNKKRFFTFIRKHTHKYLRRTSDIEELNGDIIYDNRRQ